MVEDCRTGLTFGLKLFFQRLWHFCMITLVCSLIVEGKSEGVGVMEVGLVRCGHRALVQIFNNLDLSGPCFLRLIFKFHDFNAKHLNRLNRH